MPQDTGLKCPACDYNLTGLTEPRCPECGAVFEIATQKPRPPYGHVVGTVALVVIFAGLLFGDAVEAGAGWPGALAVMALAALGIVACWLLMRRA